MKGRRLIGAVRAAHHELDARFAAVGRAEASARPNRLRELRRAVDTTARAKESVLFPVLTQALGEDTLAQSCVAEHRDVEARLDALASNPTAAGFPSAVAALARDNREHLQDEEVTIVPVLNERLGEAGSEALAEAFERALAP